MPASVHILSSLCVWSRQICLTLNWLWRRDNPDVVVNWSVIRTLGGMIQTVPWAAMEQRGKMGQVYCIAGYCAATKTAPARPQVRVSRTTDADQMYNTLVARRLAAPAMEQGR